MSTTAHFLNPKQALSQRLARALYIPDLQEGHMFDVASDTDEEYTTWQHD